MWRAKRYRNRADIQLSQASFLCLVDDNSGVNFSLDAVERSHYLWWGEFREPWLVFGFELHTDSAACRELWDRFVSYHCGAN